MIYITINYYNNNTYESETDVMFKNLSKEPLLKRKDLKPETIEFVKNLLKSGI